jgi:membrane protein DedA with SNARE-associated domain
MRFLPFTISTLAGSFAWSLVLAWFGREVLGGDSTLLDRIRTALDPRARRRS